MFTHPRTAAVTGMIAGISLAASMAALPPPTAAAAARSSYPAAYAELSGGATTVACDGPGCEAPQSVRENARSSTEFLVDAASDGYYDLSLRGASGSFRLAASGTDLGAAETARVYLHAGINPVQYAGAGVIGGLDVTPDAAAAVSYAAAAPSNTLSGAAVVASDPYAYGGKYVGYIGNGAANTLTFTGVRAARAGTYRVMLSYSDNDRAGSGNYNANLIDRGFTVSTSAGTSSTVYARNTYSWDQFDTIELTVRLAAGTNTITFGNPLGYAPNIDKITVAPAVLP